MIMAKNVIADKSIAAIRALLIDTINKASSGHPGMALDAAPIMYALYHDHLKADPKHPDFFDRDRFILSAGHTSALLYSTLHVAGYAISMDDMKSFRQLGSLTPGHPEVGLTPGVDATSGPLGQGIAQAVGFALAEQSLRARYPGFIDHFTYCLCGDGCLMEGVSQEAISLAGHLKLNKLILIYDANEATLDGPTTDSFDEFVKLRFLASNWNVLEVKDGNNVDAISKAISKAKKSSGFPTLIIVNTRIGYGTEKEGSHTCHGSPLGKELGDKAKAFYGVDYPEFTVPAEVYDDFKPFASRGLAAYQAYQEKLNQLKQSDPEAYASFMECLNPKPIESVDVEIPEKMMSTRAASGKILNALHRQMPSIMGGSADVAGSTMTNIEGEGMYTPENGKSRDLHFGIREFAMAACCNGMALHGGVLPYCATFFVFSDYLKPALRMAALQHAHTLFILTHDSIAVGEDGPTHQPIDQYPMLRAIPNLRVYRPADFKEVIGSYLSAINDDEGPSALILSRQNLPQLEKTDVDLVDQGAYLVYGTPKTAKLALLATGSEVSSAIEVAKKLDGVCVFSLPCLERIDQSKADKLFVLPYEKRVSIEMGSTLGWAKYAKHNIGIDTFGASGKDKDVIKAFGFDVDSLKAKVEEFLK